ncbi:MAG TPA: glycosyltransferase family 87 protein, partial [Candidatus Rubrimentiphilum sp.]|nr:glycosyltransferase family 87 protein [Candidatus Rubrimentiphilum sp.]
MKVLLGDFRAFYCGGSMVLHGNNPYFAGPLLRCEQTPQPFGLHSVREADLPAPFPGYALLFFAIFAFLPYVIAATIWLCLLIVCTAAACVFLARLCGLSVAAVFVLIAVAYCVSVIPYGELAPIILAALTAGALALRRGFIGGATIGLAILALLPHIALPAYIAVFIWSRAMRLPVAGLIVLLVALDVAAGGPQVAVAYLVHVLPNHAASEIGFVTQYSATWMAQGFGASDRVALIAGEVSYGLAVVAGVWLAGLVAARLRDAAFLMLVPAALAVTGGSFVHYSEITLALPAALLLFSRATGVTKMLAAIAVVCVALPWQSVVTQPLLIVALVIGAI